MDGNLQERLRKLPKVDALLAGVVEELLDHLLREPWNELRTAPLAAALLARRTDDRSRDVSAGLRSRVIVRLEAEHARADWIHFVRNVVAPENTDQAALFGEELPVGLRLT